MCDHSHVLYPYRRLSSPFGCAGATDISASRGIAFVAWSTSPASTHAPATPARPASAT
ncbi:hypothetical protein NOCA2310114 [metagenome]|uniref:Uncharacterized protein n=1 Tax=metagenome TaxID=256318 RepID=A0A2P2C5J0_9ZZZZ